MTKSRGVSHGSTRIAVSLGNTDRRALRAAARRRDVTQDDAKAAALLRMHDDERFVVDHAQELEQESDLVDGLGEWQCRADEAIVLAGALAECARTRQASDRGEAARRCLAPCGG